MTQKDPMLRRPPQGTLTHGGERAKRFFEKTAFATYVLTAVALVMSVYVAIHVFSRATVAFLKFVGAAGYIVGCAIYERTVRPMQDFWAMPPIMIWYSAIVALCVVVFVIGGLSNSYS